VWVAVCVLVGVSACVCVCVGVCGWVCYCHIECGPCGNVERVQHLT